MFAQVCFISFCSNFFLLRCCVFETFGSISHLFPSVFYLRGRKIPFLWMRPQICIHRLHRILVHSYFAFYFEDSFILWQGKAWQGYTLHICIANVHRRNWKLENNRQKCYLDKKYDWQKRMELNVNCLIVWDNYIFPFLRLDLFFLSQWSLIES